jgi:hypothetical protein
MPKTTITMRLSFIMDPLLWQTTMNIILATYSACSIKLTYAPLEENSGTQNGRVIQGPQNGFIVVVEGSHEDVQETLKTFQKSIPGILGEIFTRDDEALLARMKALCKELQGLNYYAIDLYGKSSPAQFGLMHIMSWHYMYEEDKYKVVFDKHEFPYGYRNQLLQSLRLRLSDDVVQYYDMMSNIACLLRESMLIVEPDEPRTLADLVDNSDAIPVIVNTAMYNTLKAAEVFQQCCQSGQSP